jgi:hypothetical protein
MDLNESTWLTQHKHSHPSQITLIALLISTAASHHEAVVHADVCHCQHNNCDTLRLLRVASK